ncbi:hypothetical protein B0T25DRAFT_280871 [Lasiosphaeria hispida]|uniref:Nephrocystin 3-like N-terminal domain-containing protein n=1 Tax=Lasiosphaeria hispida TaxID=260671 RepID=A0AAJ0MB72_9PEZI|nr:hypothetical protein B0T25DRAFT_280871 [Lasiosphaeria hispida]
MATSTVGNHSSGAQTLHSGKGAQSINTGAGVLLNVDKYIAIHNAEGSLDLVRSLFSDKEHGADGKSLPAQPSTADIVAWLRSLSPLEFYDIHTSQLKQRTAGTGEWLLKKKKFQTWKDGPDRILWLDGIIGAGKSMLASIITDHLEKEIGTANNNKACVYTSFKFHDDNEAQPTIEILVANLLMQLVRQQKTDKVHQKLVEAYHSFQSHEGSLGQEELKTLVEIQVKAFSSVFLIIDALENCSNDPSTGIREAFVKLIRKLPENCKILVTSRSGMSIGRQFEASQRIKLQASPADIKLYVQNRIRTNDEMLHLVKDGMSKNPGFEDDISAIIIKKAQGIFLLATMHMDYLATQETLGHFRTALGKLPEDPALSFSAAIQRIEKQSGFQKKLAKHVISWVLSAARPLTAGEVRHAFAVEWQEAATAKPPSTGRPATTALRSSSSSSPPTTPPPTPKTTTAIRRSIWPSSTNTKPWCGCSSGTAPSPTSGIARAGRRFAGRFGTVCVGWRGRWPRPGSRLMSRTSTAGHR